jgi:hypothetical protein
MALSKLKNPLDIYAGTDAGMAAGGYVAKPMAGQGGGGGAGAVPTLQQAPADPSFASRVTSLVTGDQPSQFLATPTFTSTVKPAPVAPIGAQLGIAPPLSQPGAVGRGLGNAVAVGSDVAAAPARAAADVVNRGLIGARNIVADAVGAPNVQAADVNYTPAQQALAAMRAANAGSVAAPGTAPATTKQYGAPAQAAPVERGQFASPAAEQAARAATLPVPTTLRDASGAGAGHFIGKDGRKTVNTNGSINEPNGTVTGVAATNGLAVQPGAVAPTLAQPDYQAPSVNLGGNTFAAEAERKARIQTVNDELFKLGTLDSRAKRDLYLHLQGQLQDLTGKAYDQAGRLAEAGASLQNQGNIAAMDVNARAGEGAADRQQRATEATLTRENQPNIVTGADGTAYQLQGGKVVPVTGTDGQPFKPAPTRADVSGQVTDQDKLKSFDEERKAVAAGALTPEAATTALAAYDASANGQQRLKYLGSQQGNDAPPGYTQVGTKAGKRVYRDAAGNTHIDE